MYSELLSNFSVVSNSLSLLSKEEVSIFLILARFFEKMYFVYLSLCLRLGLLISCLCDLFFHCFHYSLQLVIQSY